MRRVAIDLRTVAAFVKLGRPLFTVGGFLFYGLGAATAVAAGAHFDGWRYALGQIVVTAAQLMVHYANDYFDLEADRANTTPTRWSGGSRVLPDGVLPARVALIAALALAVTALTVANVLALRLPDMKLLVPLAAVMTGLAWFYSAPPLRFCARGYGEITTAIVVTLCVPALGYYLQAGALHPRLLAVCALPMALQFAMLLAIEFPDAAGDAAVGKRTIVVRIGGRAGARLYAAVTIGAFGVLPLLPFLGLPVIVATAPLVLAPLAIWQATRVVRGGYADSARFEGIAFWSVALLTSAGAIQLAATILGG
jgi:1,4-dihydroxy-2-naphthoate polyprenyltransferase